MGNFHIEIGALFGLMVGKTLRVDGIKNDSSYPVGLSTLTSPFLSPFSPKGVSPSSVQKKPEIIANSQAMVDQVNKQFKRGLITDEERYQKVVSIWTDTKKQITAE